MLLRFALLLSLASLAITGDGAKRKTHLRFYMHDNIMSAPGRPATAVRVARGTTPLPADPRINFGDMFVIDDPRTEGPAADSPAVGRAQGFFIFASQTELALMLSFNVVFTARPRNGSTIAVACRDVMPDEVREFPVVGGTGVFRGVIGYGQLRTQDIDVGNMTAVLKVDMYLRF